MRIVDLLNSFVVQLEADGRSKHTLGQYQRHIALFARWLAHTSQSDAVAEIGHETLAAFLVSPMAKESVRGGSKKPSSVNALRTSLRVVFGYAHAAGHCAVNPARFIRRARCGQAPPRALGASEVERLRAVLVEGHGKETERDRVLVELLLATGMRLASALAIDVEDVDLEHGRILLRRVKGNTPQQVCLGAGIVRVLAGHIAGRRAGPVFENGHCLRLSARHAQTRIAGWMRRAQIRRASAHSLRHTFASGLYQRSRDVLLVRTALGHRSIASTMVYAQASAEDVRRFL